MSLESETNSGADTSAPGVDGNGQTTAQTDDISTDDFDRQPAPEDDDEPEAREEGEPGDDDDPDKPTADDDVEEIEHDGQKYRVPKAVRPLLMLQADYTKKTQALADNVRAFTEKATAWDVEKTQQAESLTELRAEVIRVGVIEQTIEQVKASLERVVDGQGLKLKDVNWPAYRQAIKDLPADHEDRLHYQKLRDAYEGARSDLTDLETQLGTAKTELTAKDQARLAKQQEDAKADLAKRRQETGQALKAEVKGWNKDVAAEVITFANDHLGITPEEMADATDPRVWKLVHEALTSRAEIASLRKALGKQHTADNHAKAGETKPAATPKATGGSARDPSTPRGDGLSTEEWMRRRAAQVAKRRA